MDYIIKYGLYYLADFGEWTTDIKEAILFTHEEAKFRIDQENHLKGNRWEIFNTKVKCPNKAR